MYILGPGTKHLSAFSQTSYRGSTLEGDGIPLCGTCPGAWSKSGNDLPLCKSCSNIVHRLIKDLGGDK